MKTLAKWLSIGATLLFLAVPLWAQDKEEQRPQQDQHQYAGKYCPPHRPCHVWKCVVGFLAVIHVLLAVWVFSDIRKRGEGHGIFIVLVLLAGIPASILYALVRIGDMKRQP